MKYAILFALVLAGCSNQGASKVLSYEELKKFPVNCEKQETQLAELKEIQRIKNFNSDLEKLNEDDQLYNSRLKATIWWYAYSCEKE